MIFISFSFSMILILISLLVVCITSITETSESLTEKSLTVLTVLNLIPTPRIILDIGAHDGSWTKAMTSSSLFMKSKPFFIQIEANSDMTTSLSTTGHGYVNILLGDKDNVEIDYYKSKLDILSSSNSIYPDKTDTFRKYMNIEKMKMLTLDTLLSVLPGADGVLMNTVSMDIVKIHTCGSELLILKGATQMIIRDQPLIILEVSLMPIHAGAPLFIDIHIYMESIGYVIADIISETYLVSPTVNDEMELTDDVDIVTYNGISFNQTIVGENIPMQLKLMNLIFIPRDKLIFQNKYSWINNNYTCIRTKKLANRN